MFKIASILAGSILIPSFEIICPSNLPSSSPKRVFLGFKEMPNFLHLIKTASNDPSVNYLFWKLQ